MEVEEEPMDSADPVEETLSTHGTSADPIEMPTEIIGTSPHSGKLAPLRTSSPITVSGDGGINLNEGSRRDNPQDMEAESDEADKKFSLAKEVLEPRGIDATPAATSLPLETGPDITEGSGVVRQIVPTTERCVTPMDLLTADSPSRPRTSPKRTQLSSPEGSEIAAGWDNSIKRHRSSTPEHTPISRLPSRMPYWTPCLAEKEGPGAAGEGGDKSPLPRKDEEPMAPLVAPEDVGEPSELQRGEELKDLLFMAPLDGDKPSGPSGDEFALAQGVVDPSEEEKLPKLPEGEESDAARGKIKPVETPAETEPQPPLRPEASEVGIRPPDGDEGQQPSESEAFENFT